MGDRSFSLDGTHALIVGASGGVGRATARTLAAMGAALTLADRAAPGDLAAELTADGAAATAHACDVSDRAAVEALVEAAPRPDAVVLTAAICPWDDCAAPDWDEAWRAVIEVNLKGAVDLSRAALRRMEGHGGRIVLVGSLAGRTGGLVAGPHYVRLEGGPARARQVAGAAWRAPPRARQRGRAGLGPHADDEGPDGRSRARAARADG